MLIRGNALAIPLRDASVQCVVTSPPYWGLRDYGVAGQLGLEPTPDAYVENLVAVFREVNRVLRADGTLWLNLGDSYCSAPPGNARPDHSGPLLLGSRGGQRSANATLVRAAREFPELKPKDLVGIPWRVAFALQADGWWLRSEIIWAKTNPMPESATDRPTRAHEQVFLLSKSSAYYYDHGAIAEPCTSTAHDRGRANYPAGWEHGPGLHRSLRGRNPVTYRESGAKYEAQATRNARTVWTMPCQPYRGAHSATFPEALVRRCILAGAPAGSRVLDPFVGSGTTVRVARDLGRGGIGLDLSSAYLHEQAAARVRTTAGMGW